MFLVVALQHIEFNGDPTVVVEQNGLILGVKIAFYIVYIIPLFY